MAKFNEEIIQKCVDWIYKEYSLMIKEGHKKTYIMQYLSDQYNISERMVYNVIDKLSSNVDL